MIVATFTTAKKFIVTTDEKRDALQLVCEEIDQEPEDFVNSHDNTYTNKEGDIISLTFRQSDIIEI